MNQIYDIIVLRLNTVRESYFAKFTFQCFPTICFYTDRITFFERALRVKPFSEAFNMDILHCAITFAGWNKRIFPRILLTQAYSTYWYCLLL